MPNDTILTFPDYVQGKPGRPGAEFEHAHAPITYQDYLAHYYRRYRDDQLPVIDLSKGREALVEVNAGRWVWQCPACHSGILVHSDEPIICIFCDPLGWMTPRFPPDRADIEEELLKQPGRRLFAPVRNWEPGWTIDDLRERTRKANVLLAQGASLVRSLSIGSTRVWTDGEVLTATNMNLFGSDLADDLAGRNGLIELENSLRVLNGTGNRFVGLPRGTQAQRPGGLGSSDAGIIRWSTTAGTVEMWNGSNWVVMLDSSQMTFATLNNLGLIGSGSTQIARGNHTH